MLWSAVAVLSFFNLLNYVDRYVIAAVGPSMMKDLGLTDGQFGALGSAFLWGFLLASPFASRIIKRLPRLAVVSICVLGWSVAMAATGLVGWMGFLLAARFIFGIFQSIFTASAPPVLEDSVNPNWKARALSMFYLGLPLGTALGFIVGALFERTLGWSLGFVVLGIVGAMISFGVFLIPRRLQKEKVANVRDYEKFCRGTICA